MKYLRNFGKFLESSAVAEAPVKKVAKKNVIKHKGLESTTEAVVNRLIDLSEDGLKKLIEG